MAANCGGVKVGRGDQLRYVRFTSINGVSDIIGVLPGGRMRSPSNASDQAIRRLRISASFSTL
jgi:hypothetical protein